MTIYAYIRVSTDKQTVANQRFEINRFCKKQNLKIEQWIEETTSGTKSVEKRQLGLLLEQLKKDDILICSELSRLGRSLFMIMDVLSACMKKEIQLWTIKDNYRLGTDISSKVLAFAFGLSAEIERNLISQRTKEALARAKSEGIVLGRPSGARNTKLNQICVDAHEMIVSQMRQHLSIPKIAKNIGVARGTLYRYLTYVGLYIPNHKTNDTWSRKIY